MLHLVLDGHVRFHGDTLAPLAGDDVACFLCSTQRAVHGSDQGAFTRIHDGRRLAIAPARTDRPGSGDDGRFVFHTIGHDQPL